jgi:type IV secretory pathway VirB3-like protein
MRRTIGSDCLEITNTRPWEGLVIILGIVLLAVGFVTGIAFVWSIGGILLVIGLVLWLLGALGHSIGGRRHYY